MTYSWLISSLECHPSFEKKKNVINKIHWRLNKTENAFTASVYGVQDIEFDSSNTFTPYEKLTPDQILEWLKSSLGEEKIKELYKAVDTQLIDMINPKIITPPLPWGNNLPEIKEVVAVSNTSTK